MQSLLWQLANHTAESQFIFNLFHLLLAGLTLLVLLHQVGANRGEPPKTIDRLLSLGFFLIVLHFALLALRFGSEFFLRKELEWAGFKPLTQGLMACGLLVVVAALRGGRDDQEVRLAYWTLRGCGTVAAILFLDFLLSLLRFPSAERIDSVATVMINLLVLLAVAFAIQAVLRGENKDRQATLIALASVGAALLLNSASGFLQREPGILLWNVEEHVLSVSLFAFAWAAGERSRNLLDRVFVRLNLTFLVLASLIMLITAGMEKYQYLRLAEERSKTLAEFLRGHLVYYGEHGESLREIFQHPEVLRRVVVEFGTLPELREVSVYLDGQRASFRYTKDWEIREEIVPVGWRDSREATTQVTNGFQMIRLPIGESRASDNRVEFVGTLDFINSYIGHYIILIYSLFTVMVAVATGIIGIIVTDTDRRLRQQYAELQETHQQLAQAAKLASVGQLAGGVAHEINNPITSILSLASHLAEEKSAARLEPRQRRSLQVIAQQAERVSRIVGNLLMFARQSNLDLSRVDMAELLDTAITMVQYRLKDSAIHLRQEIGANLPHTLGDAGRLTEVFVNLLNNAIDAMPPGGTLIVRAFPNQAPDSGVRVEVVDTGCGIPPEQLPHIYDPFFTTKEPGRGTGLGLSISHGIVKDHGGQIWAESQPGMGTMLVVTLPKGGEWK